MTPTGDGIKETPGSDPFWGFQIPPNHSYSAPGAYFVTVSSNVLDCHQAVIRTITSKPIVVLVKKQPKVTVSQTELDFFRSAAGGTISPPQQITISYDGDEPDFFQFITSADPGITGAHISPSRGALVGNTTITFSYDPAFDGDQVFTLTTNVDPVPKGITVRVIDP